jgi:hypothetical protein
MAEKDIVFHSMKEYFDYYSNKKEVVNDKYYQMGVDAASGALDDVNNKVEGSKMSDRYWRNN